MKIPALAVCLALASCSLVAAVDAPLTPALAIKVDATIARADLAAYRGWIKYLRNRAETALAHGDADGAAHVSRLTEWVDRVAAEPNTLAALRGVQEWAYESPVDGTGQPFKIVLPEDYRPGVPAALVVQMHGYGGNHLEHYKDLAPKPGIFQLTVLARGRSGWYRGLAEADVLQAIDYVAAHWAIDPDRIHLVGTSMGGQGVYRLAARYPHRWASARPTCGYVAGLPLGNLRTLPIYAIHSADDPVVPVLHARAPLARLREIGGQVIYDETNGFGHAAWTYEEGKRRSAEWAQAQVRPAAAAIRHIDYTATDGIATRGWWAEVAEWGPAVGLARFVLTVSTDGILHAELTNVASLRLHLAESPFNRAQPLTIAVNGQVPITLPAPLPATAVIAQAPKGWAFVTPQALPFRLRTPGGPMLLYDGEPLLIVYGTNGTAAEQAALRSAADAASQSPSPEWAGGGEPGPDGVPLSQNLYGRLAIKSDAAVTPEDIARCHLVLIGNAAQNSLVRKMAGQLPVTIAGDAVTTSDGQTYPFAESALGLVHYNPLAPQRLVFWVAGSSADACAAVTARMACGQRDGGFDADLLIVHGRSAAIVAARSFDSRWNWADDRTESPLVPAWIRTERDFSAALGSAVCRAADAEVALVTRYGEPDQPHTTPGITRVSDLLPFFWGQPLGVCSLRGDELNALVAKAPQKPGKPLLIADHSGLLTATAFTAVKRYRVAIPLDVVWALGSMLETMPADYQLIEPTVYDAVARHLGE